MTKLKSIQAALIAATLLLATSAAAYEPWLPAGTVIPVRFQTTASSATSRPGDVVLAEVRDDVVWRGRVVIPAGSEVRGRVVSARRSGKVKGRAYLAVRFDSVRVRGRSHEISTGALSRVAGGTARRDAALIGGGVYNAGTLTADATIVFSNTASSGGGILNNGRLTATALAVRQNSAAGGGGIYSAGPLTLASSEIVSNTATQSSGGGLFSSGALTLTQSMVTSNTTPAEGGLNP